MDIQIDREIDGQIYREIDKQVDVYNTQIRRAFQSPSGTSARTNNN